MRPFFGFVFVFACLLTNFNFLAAQQDYHRPTSYWPTDVEFDPVIPTPKESLGFEIGQRHLSHAQLVDYLTDLAESSDRIQLQRFGKTHAGRPQLMLTITSPTNHERLDEIRDAHKQLANPAQSGKVDIENLPAVINMGYGVHGDEPSATNVSPLVAHYLAAAQSPEVDCILENCVVLLDPCLNPDGFNRFANWVNAYRGRVPSSDPNDAEHNQGWPPGRVNYYWFDLNRDWLPIQHPESQNRVRMFHKWKPNVVLDFHEMGTNSTYFFQPGIPQRTNPYTPEKNIELTNRFGEYHAKALDQKGSLYFTQERFDDFYMGKGSTYPDLHGAVGILFEQASSRGHIQRNQDGLLKFHDTIANHFATSLSSLNATTDMRMELNGFKRTFYKQSIRQAEKHDGKTLVFQCEGNQSRLQSFADILLQHEIKCFWLDSEMEYGDEMLGKNSLVVPVRQPEYRFLKSLLMRETNFKENIFYDVSTWTLPLAFNLQQRTLQKAIPGDMLTAAQIRQKHSNELKFSKDDLAYLIEWTDDQSPVLAWQLHDADVNIRASLGPFVTSDYPEKTFASGTLQVFLGTQKKAKTKKIRSLLAAAAKRGVKIHPVTTGLTPTGSDLGSSDFPVLKKPNVASVVGRGMSNYEAGEFWHLMDTQINMPVNMLKLDRLSRTNLDDYTAIVMTTGNFGSLGESGMENLKDWINSGGTAVLTGSGAKSLASELGSRRERDSDDKDSSDAKDEKKEDEPKQKPFAQASTERALQLISGAIFETQIDTTHPLYFGFTHDRLPVFRNHTNNMELSKSPYHNPGIYTDSPLMAGYCSDENTETIAKSASVVVLPQGRGRIVVISDNPNFRGFWYGSRRVLLNAIFFGQMVR
jgi:hypothetical protein